MSETEVLNPDNFILILSVGGSPEPLIKSINYFKPYYVIFVASKNSNAKIIEILQKTEGIKKHETITLSDFQDVIACVRDLREELPKKIEAMNLPPDILLVADITGGTKVMSSALTVAMMEFNSRFSYVGGTKRTKPDQTGTVEDGYEVILYGPNPWDALGVREAKDLTQAFNSGQFAAAKEKADTFKYRANDYKAFYDGLSLVTDAFRSWDAFNYRAAKNAFIQGLGKLYYYNNRAHKNFCPLYGQLEKCSRELEKVANEARLLDDKFQPLESGTGYAYIRDLIANAKRCAARGHYDDAVARLYSAIEKTAKITLAQRGINNSDMPKEVILKAGDELASKYGCLEMEDKPGPVKEKMQEKIKVPLGDSYRVLCAIAPDDPISCSYVKHADNLEKALESRNMSLLAHGYRPVNEDDYQNLYQIALSFLNIDEKDLPEFPVLEIKQILF